MDIASVIMFSWTLPQSIFFWLWPCPLECRAATKFFHHCLSLPNFWIVSQLWLNPLIILSLRSLNHSSGTSLMPEMMSHIFCLQKSSGVLWIMVAVIKMLLALWTLPCPSFWDQNCSKTLPFGAWHTEDLYKRVPPRDFSYFFFFHKSQTLYIWKILTHQQQVAGQKKM